MISNKTNMTVTAFDLVVLLHNALLANEEKDVGFEDVDETIETLTRKMDKTILMKKRLVESCLWACNLRSERNRFWHPQGLTLDHFLSKMVPKEIKFNKDYNYFEDNVYDK